ncbi:MAG: DUF1501 domain-containing protein [Acidobacteria bacterium]|nr:DUF1501 domain-containing protein [Acidobacteriota bacterium]
MRNRREFVTRCGTLAAMGAGAQLLRLGIIAAKAQTAQDYKALVCVFLFGGNDGNNTIVPTDSRYAAYQAMRPNISLAQNVLLPVGAQGTSYGLHPRLLNVQRLYNAQRVALIFNVGTLVSPTTKANLNSVTLPRNLYSHSDQTSQWQTANPTISGGSGWGGRMADILATQSAATFPIGVSVNGGSALLNGNTTRPISLMPGSSLELERFGDGSAMNAREAGLQQLLTFDTGMQMIGAASGVMTRAVSAAQAINAALAGGTPLTTVFPNTGLAQQLRQVASVIRVRAALGMNRQIFFCGMGGFDNHSDLLPSHDNLLNTLDGALSAFIAATDEMGVSDAVTTFTESEFGRTGNPSSSNGSDHAWGSHTMVLGGTGALNGGQAFGTFPRHELRGPDDAGSRGLWIPTTALDQYGATLASWFGLSATDLNTVFPNLRNFASPTIGFMR